MGVNVKLKIVGKGCSAAFVHRARLSPCTAQFTETNAATHVKYVVGVRMCLSAVYKCAFTGRRCDMKLRSQITATNNHSNKHDDKSGKHVVYANKHAFAVPPSGATVKHQLEMKRRSVCAFVSGDKRGASVGLLS